MRIVVEPNVLVAGLLSPFGPCAEIVRMISSGELTLVLDARILSEYNEVLCRPKFRFDIDRVVALLDNIEHRGQIMSASPLSRPLPDPADEPYFEIAVAGRAVCLVAGNRAHFPAKLCQGVAVFSPGDFVRFYRKQQEKKGG
jgi:putative PIN family toxin of toxin-antitoxin system